MRRRHCHGLPFWITSLMPQSAMQNENEIIKLKFTCRVPNRLWVLGLRGPSCSWTFADAEVLT